VGVSEGFPDGASVGLKEVEGISEAIFEGSEETVGKPLGWLDFDGIKEGSCDKDGSVEGTPVGLAEGVLVGTSVGELEGIQVGLEVGTREVEGEAEGDFDGIKEGLVDIVGFWLTVEKGVGGSEGVRDGGSETEGGLEGLKEIVGAGLTVGGRDPNTGGRPIVSQPAFPANGSSPNPIALKLPPKASSPKPKPPNSNPEKRLLKSYWRCRLWFRLRFAESPPNASVRPEERKKRRKQ